jgi:hypothetical protein
MRPILRFFFYKSVPQGSQHTGVNAFLFLALNLRKYSIRNRKSTPASAIAGVGKIALINPFYHR